MVETTGDRRMPIHTTDKPFTIAKRQVYEAYRAVKSNGGAAGVDKQTIEQFEADLQNHLYKLWNRMSSGSYSPPPVRAVSIPKKSGGQRILGIPTVADRVAQMVVKQLIEPDLEPIFLADSYGYRPGKSALDVNQRLLAWVRRKYKGFKAHKVRASHLLQRLSKRSANLFEHWRLGMVGTFP